MTRVYINRLYPSGPNTPDLVASKYEKLLLALPDKPQFVASLAGKFAPLFAKYLNMPPEYVMRSMSASQLAVKIFVELHNNGLAHLEFRNEK